MKHTFLRLFNRLPAGLRFELFYQAGRSLGIESYAVAGPIGTFAGPLSDMTITKSYLQGIVWAQREIDVLKGFFRDRPGTLFDIGANIGTVTIPLAQAGVKVVAFEPDPQNCSLLRGNVARQQQQRVEIVEKAVYREQTTLRFTKSAFNSGDHRLSTVGEIEVSAIPLDTVPTPSGPFAIKIDTQGAEPGVFEGGRRTILAADMVLSEFWPYGIQRMGNTPDAVIETVKQFPHARFIDKRETPWMSGPALADHLHTATKNLDANADMDFVIAKEPF